MQISISNYIIFIVVICNNMVIKLPQVNTWENRAIGHPEHGEKRKERKNEGLFAYVPKYSGSFIKPGKQQRSSGAAPVTRRVCASTRFSVYQKLLE
jgi:hypothetical protein